MSTLLTTTILLHTLTNIINAKTLWSDNFGALTDMSTEGSVTTSCGVIVFNPCPNPTITINCCINMNDGTKIWTTDSISTIGYNHITFEFRMNLKSIEDNEYFKVYYSIDNSLNWIDLVSYTQEGTKTRNINLPTDANDNIGIRIMFELAAAGSNDQCYLNSGFIRGDLITGDPTKAPTSDPTPAPTAQPTAMPTPAPTINPTTAPSVAPTPAPTNSPFVVGEPTESPSDPSTSPTRYPTYIPTYDPTNDPTFIPTVYPTNEPTIEPTNNPSFIPTKIPTNEPTYNPIYEPTIEPTTIPTVTPTNKPTNKPSNTPIQMTTTRDGNSGEIVETTSDGKGKKIFDDPISFLEAYKYLLMLIGGVMLLCCCFCVVWLMHRNRKQKATLDQTNIELQRIKSLSDTTGTHITALPVDSDGITETTNGHTTTGNTTNGSEQAEPDAEAYSNDMTVKMWLENIKLLEYYDIFIQHGFADSTDALLDLNNNDLKEMGIHKIAHRKMILKQIQKNNLEMANIQIEEVKGEKNVEEGGCDDEQLFVQMNVTKGAQNENENENQKLQILLADDDDDDDEEDLWDSGVKKKTLTTNDDDDDDDDEEEDLWDSGVKKKTLTTNEEETMYNNPPQIVPGTPISNDGDENETEDNYNQENLEQMYQKPLKNKTNQDSNM